MHRNALVVAVGTLLAACSPAPGPQSIDGQSTVAPSAVASASAAVGNQAEEEAAVLAATDQFMKAISSNDLAGMAAMQTSDGMTYVALLEDGKEPEIVGRPSSYWVDSSRAGGPPMRERYWSPTVLVRGPMAMVWAPYEFRDDGKVSHCGVDMFSFIKRDGAWRVANMMWTVEPKACAQLMPADTSVIRPADGP